MVGRLDDEKAVSDKFSTGEETAFEINADSVLPFTTTWLKAAVPIKTKAVDTSKFLII